MTAVLYYRWLAEGLHDKIISQGIMILAYIASVNISLHGSTFFYCKSYNNYRVQLSCLVHLKMSKCLEIRHSVVRSITENALKWKHNKLLPEKSMEIGRKAGLGS